MKLVVHRRAWDDVEEIASGIAIDQPVAAERFMKGAEATFLFLLDNPKAGTVLEPPFQPLPGLRFWPMSPYRNYITYYRIEEDRLEILRVVHAARDRNRLFER